MRRLIPFLLALLTAPTLPLATAASAQVAVFEPGYVVVDGDTLRGEVNVGIASEAATGVAFRPSGGPPRRVGAGEAQGFGTDRGLVYRAGSFRVRLVPDPSAHTPLVREGFARVVRDGAAELLEFEPVLRRPLYFVRLRDGDLVGLYDEGRGAPPGRSLYRQALLTLFGDCAGDPSGYTSLSYSERALAGAVDRYNACVSPGYVPMEGPHAQRPGVRIRLGVDGLAGSFARAQAISQEDPVQAASRLWVQVAMPTSFFPRWVEATGEVALTRGLVEIASAYYVNPTRVAIDALHVGLGMQGRFPAGDGDVRLGVGYVIGTNLSRTSGTPVEDGDGTLRFIDRKGVRSSGGPFASAAYARSVRGLELSAVLRVQRIATSYAALFLPFGDGRPYAVDAVSLGLGIGL